MRPVNSLLWQTLATAASFWLVATTFISSGVHSQQFPSQQRGRSADTAYQVGEIDSVNLFNGGLSLSIPIGPSYPVSPALSYSLVLTYSSNGWDFDDASCFNTETGVTDRYNIPVQSPHTNAGFGWRITPGKLDLDPPVGSSLTYISSDGGEHGLYTELHPGYPLPGSQADTWFTNDSTYLRMRYYNSTSDVCTDATGGSSDCYQVEFPNGTLHEFHSFPSGSDPNWLLTRMEDRFEHDHFVEFDYSTQDEWTITDSHDRTHKVMFSGGKITRVELAAFGTATPAVYQLIHTPTTIDRQDFFPPGCDNTGSTISVPLLTKVTFPDSSYYAMSYESATSMGKNSGGIETLRLPSGGGYAWSYEQIDFISQAPELNGPEYARSAYAVSKKELYTSFAADDNPGTKIGEWNYAYAGPGDNPGVNNAGAVPCYHTVTVTDPLGHSTVNYFETAPSDISRWQRGLPFTRCDDAGVLQTPPYLSQEIYEGDPDTGTLLRSIYVDYESDGRDAGSQQEKNHRLRLRRIEYEDDPNRFKQTVFEDFDGLGQYRKVTVTGNFTANEERIITTDFNPNSGTLKINPENSTPVPGNGPPGSGNTFSMPARDDPWVLGTFTRRDATQDGDTATQEFCFNTDNGFLLRSRVWAGTSASEFDILAIFEEEGNTGFTKTESTYGGDPGGLETGDLCSMELPDEPQKRLKHTYAYGVLESTQAVDPCDDTTLLQVADHDIDQNTGLIATTRDSAEVPIVLDYDLMNRRISSKPAGSAATFITYSLPTSTTGSPTFTMQQCPAGQTSCSPLTWRRSLFDGLGRMTRQEIQYPDASGPASGAFREFSYDALNRKTAESQWENASLTTAVTYDRFGRPTLITPPDSTLAPTVITYRGEQRIDRSDKISTGDTGQETYACVREQYDTFGRLILVSENRASNNTGDCSGGATGEVTTYEYDESNRLTKVCRLPNSGACAQEREFTYDNRGFLLSEKHPEIGSTGHGLTQYTYDASGNLLTSDIAGTSDFSLRYRYDAANRLIAVDQFTPPMGTRPIKSFHYARSNDGSNLQEGKLVLAKRVNWVDPVGPLPNAISGAFGVTVSQAYRYEGLDGRISARQTRYSFENDHFVFTTGFTYDDLGNINQLTYPDCLHDGCVGEDPDRTISHTYSRGYLNSIPGYATVLRYQLGGMLHTVQHQNGVTETIEPSPKNYHRPHRITTSSGWNSGEFTYDSSGNIKQIGPRFYKYDQLNRLVRGDIEVGGQSKRQSATHDSFGNLVSLTTDGVTLATPAANTNRLQGGTYDAAGNLTDVTIKGNTFRYDYDALNMMKTLQSTTDQGRIFIYDASDQRILTTDCAFIPCQMQESRATVTVRDLDGKVLRIYEQQPFGESWEWKRDYIYRDDLPLATVQPDPGGGEKVSHLHLDQLGSIRQVTDENGTQTALHTYYPFGQEATIPAQDGQRLKFTGHERDLDTGDTALDYMQARYCSPALGRFLAVDPVVMRSPTRSPQAFNRYQYARNTPLKFVDPDGRSVVGWVVKILDTRKVFIRPIHSNKEAARLQRQGADIVFTRRAKSKAGAKAGGGGKKPVRDPAHPDRETGSLEGRRPHHHIHGRPEREHKNKTTGETLKKQKAGHGFWSVIGGLTVSYWTSGHGAVAEALGEVADLFNPASIFQDTADLTEMLTDPDLLASLLVDEGLEVEESPDTVIYFSADIPDDDLSDDTQE